MQMFSTHALTRCLTVLLLLGLTSAKTLNAQKVSTDNRANPTVPVAAYALPAEPAPPNLDGKLDDPVWQDAMVITGFTQINPNDGTEPSERTEVRIT